MDVMHFVDEKQEKMGQSVRHGGQSMSVECFTRWTDFLVDPSHQWRAPSPHYGTVIHKLKIIPKHTQKFGHWRS